MTPAAHISIVIPTYGREAVLVDILTSTWNDEVLHRRP
jgi:hypothetical protein